MVDLEHIRLEPITLGDGAGIGHHRGRLAVASVDVMPERKVGAPPHLHQRRDFRPGENGFDAPDQRCGRFALGLPVDVIEQRGRGHDANVDVVFFVDQLVEALRATTYVLVFRIAKE